MVYKNIQAIDDVDIIIMATYDVYVAIGTKNKIGNMDILHHQDW